MKFWKRYLLILFIGAILVFVSFYIIGYFSSKKIEKLEIDFVNSHYDGLATIFNCKREKEGVLTCKDSIKFVKEDSDYKEKIEKVKSELRRPGFEEKKVWMILENENNWNEVKDLICQKLNGKNCQDLEERVQRRLISDFNIKGCQCDGIGIYLKEGVIFYEYER